MKKVVKVTILVLVALALINGGKTHSYQKGNVEQNGNQQVSLMDFDNSGDPEYISIY